MAHRWDQKPNRDAEHVVTCEKCGVVVEHTLQQGKWANFHTLPGGTRQRGLAPKCSEGGAPGPAKFVATVERRPQTLTPKGLMTSEQRRLYEVEQLVKELFTELLPVSRYGHWSFKWDHAKKRYGQCNYTYRVISLSRHWALVRPLEETRVTIIHEIAHARTPGHHHDRVWVAEAQALGIKGERCSDSTAKLKAKYEATCWKCGRTSGRHKMSVHLRNGGLACSYCCKKYNGGRWSAEFRLNFIQMY